MKSLTCNFHPLNNQALMSLNRYLYILKGADSKYQVTNQREHEGTVHFAVFESEDLVAMTDDSHKLVNFYKLHDILHKGEFNAIRTQ